MGCRLLFSHLFQTRKMRVVIADDHRVFTQGFAALFESHGIQVAGVTADRDELVPIISRQRPDVAVIDLCMPGTSIPDILRALHEQRLPTQVLVITGSEQPHLVEEMLAAGARGYVLKTHAFEEIMCAVRAITEGKTYVSPELVGEVLAKKRDEQSVKLTARQTEILRLVAAGDTSKRIARKLEIHIKTVEQHRARIRERLGVRSNSEMIRVATQRRLI